MQWHGSVMRVVLVADPVRHDDVLRRIVGAAVEGLVAARHEVEVIDLVDRGFPHVMSTAERRAYFSPEPLVTPETAESAAAVRRADALVLAYPTTLSTVTPGIKGWVERTLVPGVAFTLGDPTVGRRGLTNIRRLVGISVYDEPRRQVARTGDNGRRMITRNIRMCGGVWTRSSWFGLYGLATGSDADVDRFADRVGRRLSRR